MILIKLVFNMILLMVNIKIWLKTQSHKASRDTAFEIASNLKYDGYQRGLALMVYKLFDKENLLEEV